MEQLLSQENTTQRNKKISGHFGGGCIDIVYLESLFWHLFSIDLFFTYQIYVYIYILAESIRLDLGQAQAPLILLKML